MNRMWAAAVFALLALSIHAAVAASVPDSEAKTIEDQVVERMKSTIIPNVDFRAVNIHDAIRFFSRRSGVGRDEQGFNIVLVPSEAEQGGNAAGLGHLPRLEEVSVYDSLTAFCTVFGAEWSIRGSVIYVHRPGMQLDDPLMGKVLPRTSGLSAHAQLVLDQMEQIEIPELDFRQANLHDVIQFLVATSRDYAPKSFTEKERVKGISMVLKIDDPEDSADDLLPASDDIFGDPSPDPFDPFSPTDRLITLNMRYVSLRAALDTVCMLADLEWSVGRGAIIVTERPEATTGSAAEPAVHESRDLSIQTARNLIDFGLVILIWLVQIVIYPSLRRHMPEGFVEWHRRYSGQVTVIVAPLMFAQVGIVGWQLWSGFSVAHLASALMVTGCWISTAVLSVPCHNRLQREGHSIEVIDRLVKTNWIRTGLWSGVFVLGMMEWCGG